MKMADLPPNDARQIEVFLRFAGRTAQFQWTATSGDLVDLRLAAVPADGARPVDDAVPHAWILDRGQRAPDDDAFILRRPLQMDGFEALLRTRELEVARDMAAIKARPVARVASTREPFVDDGHTTYRLLQWPTGELLRGNPQVVRILGFLSARPLTLKRLAALSGVGETACRDLLAVLDERRLLIRAEHLDASASVADILGVPRESAATTRPRDSANAGLFSRLRKRLGLG